MRAVAALIVGSVLTGCSSIGTLEFTDDNNYAYMSNIGIQSIPIAAGQNPCFDWSGLTTDIRGRAFDGVVDEAYFTLMEQSQEETVASFEDNTFIQADVKEPFADNPPDEARDGCGEDFSVIGNDFMAEDFEAGGDWLITLMKFRDSPAGGLDPIMSLFVVPDDTVETTTVSVSDDSMDLEITGLDIAGAPRIAVSTGTNRADWTAVTVDVYGNNYSNQDGNDLFIARFDVESVEEIEATFLTLDTSAAEIYRREVFGFNTLEDLSSAVSTTGENFPGFTTEGIWVFGIACSICNNPAPLLLSVLEVQ
ncbi:MAG: hypothetical protein AAGA48_35835 [Myxococcota bacterium]